MPKVRIGGPKDFWNRIKSISVAEIAREANRPISVAIVGDEAGRNDIMSALFKTAGTSEHALPESPYVRQYRSMSATDGFPQVPDVFDFVIDVGGGRTDAESATIIYSIPDIGGWDSTLKRIFEDRNDLCLSLARNFPAFRKTAAEQVIQQTAMTNAEFSLITGVASAFPLFELVLPANALSDILVLTKNQIMMSLRLAAIYGLEVNYRTRMKDLMPIFINAFGWRAIARELVGAVPAVGFIFRAMISYAGTVTVGKAAQMFYENGESVTRTQAQRIYNDAYQGSKERIRSLAARVRTSKRGNSSKLPRS